MMPWPGMKDVVNLSEGHLACLAVRTGSAEEAAGYDIAVHNAARGRRVVLFAPRLPPHRPQAGLTVDRSQPLTAEHIRVALERAATAGDRADLVVIDHAHLLHTQAGPVRTGEELEDISISLKQTAMSGHLGQPPLLLLTRLGRPRLAGTRLDIEDLGIAADLEYHADSLVLADRTDSATVDIFIAKDRGGPAPRYLTVAW